MTDFRGTEQELWDEQAIPDEERDTLIFGQRPGHVPATGDVASSDGEAIATSDTTSTDPASEARAERVESPVEVPVESVARFIAEPGLIKPSPERELDAPRRSLAALELLDAEEGAEASDLRAPPLPPALPVDAKPAAVPESTSATAPVGPVRSARADVTERVTTIPRTHPMANSIAPGGSPLSTRPLSPKRAARWQVGLGVAALLLIGVAARLLQSRGEHHAASGARSGAAEETAEARPSVPAPSARAADEAAREAAERAAAEAALMSVGPAPRTPIEPPTDTGKSPAAQKSHATTPARSPAGASEASARRRVRVGVGGARLLDKAAGQASQTPEQLDRGRIVQALTALTPRLKDCVGDEHGIADVTITVRAPGVVSHALVQGPYAGSDKGSCIARALRSAKVPGLKDPVARIEYPFQL